MHNDELSTRLVRLQGYLGYTVGGTIIEGLSIVLLSVEPTHHTYSCYLLLDLLLIVSSAYAIIHLIRYTQS